jgi:low temperature requirement protein LtrA
MRRLVRDQTPDEHTSRRAAELRASQTVKPLELFFDLVFVLGFTQCTALMADEPDWAGVGRGLVVLAVLWWAWQSYAWLTSYVEPEEGLVRIVVLAAMAALLIVTLSIPEAFGDRALTFAIAYGAVRVGHIALYSIAGRSNPGLRRRIMHFAATTAIVVALLIAAAFVDGGVQMALWLLAILVDGGAALAGIAAWPLAPAHFAERHSLVIIIALGESIVALGVGADVDLTALVIVAAVLGMGLVSALWWIYFDVVALVTERRLARATEGRERNALARDSYTYLHFPMVAGIVLIALGLKKTLAHVGDPLDLVPAAALLGGAAVYLLAHVSFRLRNLHTLNKQRLVCAVLLLALIPVGVELPALATLGVLAGVLTVLIAYEAVRFAEARDRVRHQLASELASD